MTMTKEEAAEARAEVIKAKAKVADAAKIETAAATALAEARAARETAQEMEARLIKYLLEEEFLTKKGQGKGGTK